MVEQNEDSATRDADCSRMMNVSKIRRVRSRDVSLNVFLLNEQVQPFEGVCDVWCWRQSRGSAMRWGSVVARNMV